MNGLVRSVLLLVCCFLILGCLPATTATPGPVVVKTCTLQGCGYTLRIGLTGQIPDDYFFDAVAVNGKALTAHCVKGALAEGTYYDASPVCAPTEVWIPNFQPKELTVTLRWEGHRVSHTFHPTYPIFYPNGPECEPACPAGTVEFLIPENP